MSANKHFSRLDAIRGVAIAWVLLFHIYGASWGWDVAAWPNDLPLIVQPIVRLIGMGRLGVPIFFVLSGFLIHYTFSRSSDQSVRTFLIRRCGRIYPPYLVALVVIAAVRGYFWTRHGRNDILNHALFVHTFKPEQFFSINASFWSLAHEFQLYLLYPLLLKVCRKVGMPTVLWASLVVRIVLSVLTMNVGNISINSMLPKLYFEWILGMYVADCFLQSRRAIPCPAWVGWASFGVAFFAAGQGWWELLTIPAISLATAIWVDRIVHLQHQPLKLEAALMPLGVVSYSLYLWHQPIVNELCHRMMTSTRGLNTLGPGGLFLVVNAVCCVVCTIVAVGAYQMVEAPCMAWIKRLTSKPPVAPPAETAVAVVPLQRAA